MWTAVLSHCQLQPRESAEGLPEAWCAGGEARALDRLCSPVASPQPHCRRLGGEETGAVWGFALAECWAPPFPVLLPSRALGEMGVQSTLHILGELGHWYPLFLRTALKGESRAGLRERVGEA